jgi:hypothetical protein
MGLGTAFRAFFKALGDREFSGKVDRLLKGEPVAEPPKPEIPKVEAAPPKPVAPPVDPLQILGVLQRDGRLLDFLGEDIAGYEDAQIGAAVRDVHRDCKKALAKYLDLAPVIDKEEGSQVQVPTGFDPTEIRVIGNVRGQPPFRGALMHRGWRVASSRLAPVEGGDPQVLAPAEVEIG